MTTLADLIYHSDVRFGTSGLRGLADELTDKIAYGCTQAFLKHLQSTGQLRPGQRVAIAGDLRPSTDRLMTATATAVKNAGYQPDGQGLIPSPALALYGCMQQLPTIMVTGSHIPENRNGIKFTTALGEITKEDEASLRTQILNIPANLFDNRDALQTPIPLEVHDTAAHLFYQRYLDGLPNNCLKGLRIGFYEHSAVGRDLLPEIYESLGAEVLRFGRSERFVPVDTEAIRSDDHELSRQWAAEQQAKGKPVAAILSTDGDSDRPLVSDEKGHWLRGDVLGILVAKFLNADTVITPVSCSTALERSGYFKHTIRTKIGSPYVISGMQQAQVAGGKIIVGYEGNGGFLLQTPVAINGLELAALPTRDAVIVHLAVLLLAQEQNQEVSGLNAALPQRFTASDRLKEYPTEQSAKVLQELSAKADQQDLTMLGPIQGKVVSIDKTDGLRLTFNTEVIIHLRPSGNAPEFRCYTEAASPEQAQTLLKQMLKQMDSWR